MSLAHTSPQKRSPRFALTPTNVGLAPSAQPAGANRTPHRKYSFFGNNDVFQSSDDPEIVIAGPSETGKTVALLYRLHSLALKYPLTAAIVRKYHVDLHKSVLRTFQNKIVHPADGVRVYGGKKAEWYDYPGGARIYVAGLDRSSAELSAEFDIVYVNQAEELEIEDWETLGTRTTGRAGNYPHPALWGDCNPRNQDHWILTRAREGALTLLPTTHRDNPALYDHALEHLTPQGLKTIGRLSKLTGVRLKRLFKGEWVTPEGTVYAEFDRDLHVKVRDPSEFQYRVLALDAGFDNPAVILLIDVDADLRIHIAREFYQSGVLPSRHANKSLQWSRQFQAGLTVADPSAAGLIAELQNVGMNVVTPEIRDVEQGIDLIHELLAVQADKQPRLTVDPGCVNVINEFESYVRKKGRLVKENDHAMDAIRYFAAYTFAGEVETQEVIDAPVHIGPQW